MNKSIRGLNFNFGKEPANPSPATSTPTCVPTTMANSPFNISEWWTRSWRVTRAGATAPRRGVMRTSPGYKHMLPHLAPQGSMALLLADGSMSSGSGGEGQIRQALIEADLM
ncbi:MAG: type restriction enzyme protein [Chthoniobacter sp.]|nr:type restriction enzyme protein [Chthoniobacter sp.]